MNFDFDKNIPIYIQLMEQLKRAIISGEIKQGEQLLPVRKLALLAKVNPNTMQRALSELERLNLIYTERTNGKYVTKDENLIKKYKDDYAYNLLTNYFSGMKRIGFTKEEIINYLRDFKGDVYEED